MFTVFSFLMKCSRKTGVLLGEFFLDRAHQVPRLIVGGVRKEGTAECHQARREASDHGHGSKRKPGSKATDELSSTCFPLPNKKRFWGGTRYKVDPHLFDGRVNQLTYFQDQARQKSPPPPFPLGCDERIF